MRLASIVTTLLSLAIISPESAAQQTSTQPVDAEYTAKIRELTPTDPKWKFTTELVDYLPASTTVPTPLKVLGYVPGTVGRLSHVADINKYFRALAAASPTRTRLLSLGTSDENREELLLAIADEETIRRLDEYRAMAARLADPRGMSAADRARLIREAKPIYWVLGSIHSPETGSPEMLMELAYRMAVDDGEYMKSIRSNVITLITPVQEVDGRDRMVDVYNQSKMLKVPNRNLVYWGKYTAHDNNRDGMVVSQKITQNYMKGFLDWRPTITHDLHESVPFMYISTGTGPYNDEFDPITISEWHTLAYQEITELTRRGLAGVWTHGFYDGWAPNYMMAITQFHNSTGRFYETYTAGGAECQTVDLGAAAAGRSWDRPNPPVNGVKWCIRSNINYQQSGVLIGIKYVGDHRTTFLENNVAKAERMIARGTTSGPYAFVVPREQRHSAEAADLINLFRVQAAEIHEATSEFTVERGARVIEDRGPLPASTSGAPARPAAPAATDTTRAADTTARNVATAPGRGAGRGQPPAGPLTVRAGDWIVRMDQPYTQMIRTMLAVQRYKPDDPSPYDDTGWTIDELRHVDTYTINDSTILSKPMRKLTADATVGGRVTGTGGTLLVRHIGDWRSAVLPWKAGGKVTVADTAFTAGGATYPAGTMIVADAPKVRDAVRDLGLVANATAGVPTVRSHAITLPRIAYIHTWQETQNEGWVRFSLDKIGVPYTYTADQKLRTPGILDRYDVVIFPHSGQGGMQLVNGRPMVGPAVPWKATPRTPHLGKWDETDDIRPGMGLEGAAQVRRFVERGGLVLVEGSTSRFPIELGLT
ncbi:MAG TPA: M14 family zinc carboxypeptidase, partial [Gemmatimonadaceae bacterium]|nr:M14 family zinc carboxypeptidase [Gemmatimonadaceae bacterium]